MPGVAARRTLPVAGHWLRGRPYAAAHSSAPRAAAHAPIRSSSRPPVRPPDAGRRAAVRPPGRPRPPARRSPPGTARAVRRGCGRRGCPARARRVSARSPRATARPHQLAGARASCASETGSTTSWTGASHAGKAPPCSSISCATARSTLPMMLRCTITGRCLAAVGADVVQVEALGLVEVDLDGGQGGLAAGARRRSARRSWGRRRRPRPRPPRSQGPSRPAPRCSSAVARSPHLRVGDVLAARPRAGTAGSGRRGCRAPA